MPESMRLLNYWYWSDLASHHIDLSKSERAQLLRGQSVLRSIDLELLSVPEGKSILHLMCHLGHETMSWALSGARPTGVDFCEPAIQYAQKLAHDARINCDFLLADLTQQELQLGNDFHYIILSYGALEWLPSIESLFDVARAALQQSGRIVIIDAHPNSFFVAEDANGQCAQHAWEDVHAGDGQIVRLTRGSYLDRDAPVRTPMYVHYVHHIERIIEIAQREQYEIEHFQEYSFTFYRKFESLFLRDGYWHSELPCPSLMFSLILKKTRHILESE